MPSTSHNVTATPTRPAPGAVLTIDGTVCVSGPAELAISELDFTATDVTRLNLMFAGTCPAAGFGEVHAQLAIAATGTIRAVATSPTNTLAIGNVNVGGVSTPHVITYTNLGNTAVDMSTLAKGGRYPEMYTFTKTCGLTLAPAATCTATMVFKPTTYGLKEAAVTLAPIENGDDITGDGLHKEVLVTATGVLPNATNIDAASATEIVGPTATAPFIDGVQLQLVDPTDSGHCGNPANSAIWYHFKSANTKTLDLTHDRQRRRDGHRAVHRRHRRDLRPVRRQHRRQPARPAHVHGERQHGLLHPGRARGPAPR